MANTDYEDWGSEGDLDAASIDDEIADGETTRSTDSAAGPSVTARIGSGDKKKQLNKSEKKRLVDALRQTDVRVTRMALRSSELAMEKSGRSPDGRLLDGVAMTRSCINARANYNTQLISAAFEHCVLRELARKLLRECQKLTQICYARSLFEVKLACPLCVRLWHRRDSFRECSRNTQCSNAPEINCTRS